MYPHKHTHTHIHTHTSTVYRQKVFPVINRNTVVSAAVCASASDPDGFYSLTPDIRQERCGSSVSFVVERA